VCAFKSHVRRTVRPIDFDNRPPLKSSFNYRFGIENTIDYNEFYPCSTVCDFDATNTVDKFRRSAKITLA